MVEKFIVLLGLFLMVVTVTAESNSMTNECINFTQPYNCSNDPIITVNITSKNYILEVRASLCHDAYDYCIPDYKITYRGTCNNICQFCNRSLRLQGKNITMYITSNTKFCLQCCSLWQ